MMATKGERSIVSVLYGKSPIPGVEEEAASPLWAHASENIPLLERATQCILALLARNLVRLQALAPDILAYVANGRAGVFMGKEFGSGVYSVWIICSIAIYGWVYRQVDASWAREVAQACSDYCRAWLAFWALTVGWERPSGVIADADDPPGEARPGPVYAASPRDVRSWGTRTPRQLACVSCGERTWQRDHSEDEQWRLYRPFLDEAGIGQIVEMCLGLGWTGTARVRYETLPDGTEVAECDADYHTTVLAGLRRHFEVDCLLPVSAEDRATIKAAWGGDLAAVRQCIAWMSDYPTDYEFRLRRCERGLDFVVFGTGKRSTAPTVASRWEIGTPQGWLAVDGGERQSSGCRDAISPNEVTIVGNTVRAVRGDGKFGPRTMDLCQSSEVYRVEGGAGKPVRLIASGVEDVPHDAAPQSPPQPGAEEPSPTPSVPEGLAEDGNPYAYHSATRLVTQTLATLVTQCVGRCKPDAAAYLAGELRKLADRIAPPKKR